ncbi:phage tail tape measure protein, partial [Micromonospora sp. NPDC047465]|uniref:phage tail tape measure protein n=1 Tax=Micromonospora sp. NPDC047465 TaxID=3154813 RepID=UPI0033E80BE1
MATLADLMVKIGIDSDGVTKGTGEIESRFQKTWGRVKAGAAVAGAGIGLALAAGAMSGLEQSKLQGVLAAQLGAGPAEAAALGKLSGELYADGFGADMPAVTSAIRAAAQSGLVDVTRAADATSKATVEKLLTVGQVLEEDTSRVTAAVSTMLRTGMAKSAEDAMDLLVAATQRGANKSEDLLDTMEEYSTLFRSLGLDGPTSLGLISQALAGGARNADIAADAIKEFGIKAIDGSKGARDAYKLLG